MHVRQSTEDDNHQLALLFQITRQTTFTSRNPEDFKLSDYQKAVEGEEVFVAEINNEIIGFVSIFLSSNFIHNLFVHPA